MASGIREATLVEDEGKCLQNESYAWNSIYHFIIFPFDCWNGAEWVQEKIFWTQLNSYNK